MLKDLNINEIIGIAYTEPDFLEIFGETDDQDSEKLENQATLLSNMLKDLNINEIIGLADTEPDFLEIFRETEDQVSDWSITTKYRIQDLLISA